MGESRAWLPGTKQSWIILKGEGSRNGWYYTGKIVAERGRGTQIKRNLHVEWRQTRNIPGDGFCKVKDKHESRPQSSRHTEHAGQIMKIVKKWNTQLRTLNKSQKSPYQTLAMVHAVIQLRRNRATSKARNQSIQHNNRDCQALFWVVTSKKITNPQKANKDYWDRKTICLSDNQSLHTKDPIVRAKN